ncbi:hypothetical protein Hanom_Chr03g00199601 [Helianthus anomalus]
MELHLMTIPFNDTIFSISGNELNNNNKQKDLQCYQQKERFNNKVKTTKEGRKERTRWVEIPHGSRDFEIKNPRLYMLLKQGVDSTNHIHEHSIKNGKNF